MILWKKEALHLVGQDMHILNPVFFRAIEERDSRALAAMAVRQAEAGADALDLNVGPTKKSSDLLAWAVDTILAATQLPLFVAAQILSQPDLLQQYRGSITINSVTAAPATLAVNMEKAGEHGAELVVLLTRPGLNSGSVDDRLQLAAEVLETANQTGFPLARLHLDPLFRPSHDPVRQGFPDLDPVLEILAALPLLSREKVNSVVSLSSASAFLPAAKRSALHHRLLPLLAAAGLDTIILNCNDRRLMNIARNNSTEMPSLLLAAEAASA